MKDIRVIDLVVGVVEAGELYGRTPDAIKKLCQRGIFDGRCKRIGRSWVIERAALDEYYSPKSRGKTEPQK